MPFIIAIMNENGNEKVAVHELKANLSRYLRLAQSRPIEIMSHRKVVAKLVGVPAISVDPGLEPLLATGLAQWNGGKPVGSHVRLTAATETLSDQLLRDRD